MKPSKVPKQVSKPPSSSCIERTDTEQEDIESKFEEELCWCIQQLEIGLSSQKISPKQAKESAKILQILKNPKSSLIKKRQAMRASFGDYRKKMIDEEKVFKIDAKKMKLSAVLKSQQSTFLKKCSTEKKILQNKMSKSDSSKENFQFNFNLTPSNEENRTFTNDK